MAERWLNLEELTSLTGWSPRTIQRKVKEGNLTSRLAKDRGPNGRILSEYSSLSLSADLQRKVLDRDSGQPCTLVAANPHSAELLLFGQRTADKEEPPLPVTDAQKGQIDLRMKILAPLVEYSRLSTEGQRKAWTRQHGRVVKNLSELVAVTAKETGCGASTLWRWLEKCQKKGPNALADRIRADKGQSRWFARHRDAAILAAFLYLNERQSISFVTEQIRYEAAALDVSPDDLPSRETVRVFLSRAVSPAMRTLAREGERAYRERMAPYLRRGYVDVFANQIWVGDHAIHDAEIQNDLFDEVPFGTPGRLRMSAFVDYRSRKAWATWAWEGSSRSIAATLLRAMLEDGPPEGIYCDNGKDYKKVAKGATPASELPERDDDDPRAPKNWFREEYDRIERSGLLSRLGISVTHCIPRHPQSKHVERFFRTMHMHFDAVHSTYTSGSPFTRPEATELAMMRHRRLLKAGRVEESHHPTASRFILGCLSWIREYNATPQSGEGMDGRSPDEVFASEFNPNQKPVPKADVLALLLAEFARREVHECAVRLKNHRYTPRPEDRAAWAAMHERNESEVLVGFNPEDPEFAVVLDLDGRLIAWVEAEPLLRFAPNDPATQRQIGQSMETRRGLEKAAKATLKTIEGMARAKGARSAEEMLYGRLQIPASTGQVITQRKPRLAPDKHAVAPMTAGEIAEHFWEGMNKKAGFMEGVKEKAG